LNKQGQRVSLATLTDEIWSSKRFVSCTRPV